MRTGRLLVDWTRCDGHGLCAELLPEQVSLDDWGYPLVTEPGVSGDLAADVRRAINACPAAALRIVASPSPTTAAVPRTT